MRYLTLKWLAGNALQSGRTLRGTYTAPFACGNRKADYRIAWAFFNQAAL